MDTIQDDLELVEMVNLPETDTGLVGTIYISTQQGSHGPRIKWFPGRPGRTAPCLTVTIERPPEAINNGLPNRTAAVSASRVQEWVDLNASALLDFWNNGFTWTRDEVNTFIEGLKRLP